jgi:hypothetical protein
MYTKLCLVLIVGLVAPSTSTAQTPAQVTCDFSGPDAPCALSWNFAATPRAFYRVQQLEPSGTWRDTGGAEVNTSVQGFQIVEGGHLYRTMACEDVLKATNCVSSAVHWAPLFARGDRYSNNIPEHVEFRDAEGNLQSLLVTKELDLLAQLAQYNVYELMRSLATVQVKDLPEMTKPPTEFGESGSHENQVALVHLNVYAAYQAARGDPLPDPVNPAPVKAYHAHKPDPHASDRESPH